MTRAGVARRCVWRGGVSSTGMALLGCFCGDLGVSAGVFRFLPPSSTTTLALGGTGTAFGGRGCAFGGTGCAAGGTGTALGGVFFSTRTGGDFGFWVVEPALGEVGLDEGGLGTF